MTDQFDAASDIEQLERAAAIANHANRAREPVPMCENCDEVPVHVTDKGTRWRFCPECAEEHLRGGV